MAGRPNKYETDVKPRFKEIEEWLKIGATDKEIAENLGINAKVFGRYKQQFSDLSDLIKINRKHPVDAIKAALYKRAVGFQFTESKVVEDSEGNWKKETMTKTALPDPTAAIMLLKHWDKDNKGNSLWTSDPATLQLKKKELELKEKQAESEDW